MFAVTIVVIALIVYTLLRWIDHLAHLGRLSETTDRVEAAAIAALQQRMKRPYLGGHALPQAGRPVHARAVCSAEVGYIQHIDVPALGKLSNKPGSAVHVQVLQAVLWTNVPYGICGTA